MKNEEKGTFYFIVKVSTAFLYIPGYATQRTPPGRESFFGVRMQAEELPNRKSSAIGQMYLGRRVRVLVGDICQQQVDAIVNAANWTLLGGGGVDGAIHEAGGPQMLAECEALRRTRYPEGLPTGEAVITSGGLLPARYVIHTVGPVKGVHGDQDALLLASCYTNSLALAVLHELRTLAFPAISTGIYGYPREEAAVVASEAITQFLKKDGFLREIRLVFFTEREAYEFVAHQRFSSEMHVS